MILGAKGLFSKKDLSIIIVLLVISFALRLYQLGNVPNGLTVDEADMAYNAYSILKTQKDVYGKKLPLFFQSLDDYKPPFPIYLSVIPISLLDLTDFSIRLLPAILGSVTPVLAFFLLKQLDPKDEMKARAGFVLFIFAPWNIAISRATFMYIELIFFFLIFLTMFLNSIYKNPKLLPLSFLVLGFTLYVYYASIIYLPLILLSILFIYSKILRKNLKILIFSFIVLIVVSWPAISHYQLKESKSRLNAISVLTPDITLPTSIKEIEQ